MINDTINIVAALAVKHDFGGRNQWDTAHALAQALDHKLNYEKVDINLYTLVERCEALHDYRKALAATGEGYRRTEAYELIDKLVWNQLRQMEGFGAKRPLWEPLPEVSNAVILPGEKRRSVSH